MIRSHFWLTKDQFARLKPLLPNDTRGKPRVDDRRVISGIIHVLKSGGRWIDAPDIYGPHRQHASERRAQSLMIPARVAGGVSVLSDVGSRRSCDHIFG